MERSVPGSPKLERFAISAKGARNFERVAGQLAALGFDEISASKNKLSILKIHTKDLLGKPVSFSKISFSPNTAEISYSIPHEAKASFYHAQACLLFLRIAMLFPGVKLDAQELAKFALPVIEASPLSSQETAALLAQLKQCQLQNREISERFEKLQRQYEKEAALSLQQQRKIEELARRLEQLEGISDELLAELVLEWISLHKGSFSLLSFSRHHRINPARVQEAVNKLLASGAIAKAGEKFRAQMPLGDYFELRNSLKDKLVEFFKSAFKKKS
ncbi:MAG: hypothetical protein N3G80_03905 [Candidatus Micrarchaeota archaeon]|nr:hypothetical protein [Candidatus Micrarchaeota archaeon]